MLGENIRRERKKLNLSQQDLGKKLGVNKQTVSNWENGYRIPPTETLNEIANTFNVSVDSLLDRDTSNIPIIVTEAIPVPDIDKSLKKHVETAKEIAKLDEDDRDFVIKMIKKLNRNKKEK